MKDVTNFEIHGVSYQSDKIPARIQLHIGRRLINLLPRIRPLAIAWASAEVAELEAKKVAPEETSEQQLSSAAKKSEQFSKLRDELFDELAEALSHMNDADCDYVYDQCLAVTYRLDGLGGRQAMWNKAARREMFDDLNAVDLLTLVVTVLQANLSNFFR